ncbi:hypothetical protein ACU5EH_10835 [Aliivibrio salmonicida]|uniref:hypothetical protein n=1 Tax=Aliivibrio salmonicida TaxID=40269 RepID=UPI00406C3322
MYKTVGKAISDTVVQRLKTPLIATFIFSWLVVNHAVVLQFTFETLPNKVALAKSLEIDWWYSLGLPALVSLSYILLIPALQLGLDWLVLNTLGESRKNHDAKVARNELEATQGHQIKLRDQDLQNWAEDKETLTLDIVKLKEEMSQLVGQLRGLEQAKIHLESDIKGFKDSISKAIVTLELPAMNADTEYADTRSPEEIYNHAIEILRLALLLDEDIPF